MTREELARKSRQDLLEIAKSLGIKGLSKLNRDDLVEHILLLDPPYSANPDQEKEISQHLQNSIGGQESVFVQTRLPEHLIGVATPGEYEQNIPPDYNDTRIVLMVRDPYWLHSYWNTSWETREHISKMFFEWEQIPLILRIYDITNINFNGSNSNYYFDISINHNTNNWYIHVGGPDRSFCVDIGFVQENGNFYTIARSNTVTTPRDNVSDVIDEEWMVIEEDFRKLYRLAGGGGIGNSSIELVESLISRLEKEIGSGAISSLASPVKYAPKERKFWFVLNTELIVYGATEPDAQVSIQNEPIKLRPDGTFTLRFALPDGTQYIPVQARSADGVDTIIITPIVTKQTS